MLTFGDSLSPSKQLRSRSFGQSNNAAAKHANPSKSDSDQDEKEQTTTEIEQDPLDQAHLASSQGEPHELYDIDSVSGARNARLVMSSKLLSSSSSGKPGQNLKHASHDSQITPNLMIVSPKNHHKQQAIHHLFDFESYNNNNNLNNRSASSMKQPPNSKSGEGKKQKRGGADVKQGKKLEKEQKKKQKQPHEIQSINASIWPSLSYNSKNPFEREQNQNQLCVDKSDQIKNKSASSPQAIFEVVLPGILAWESAANFVVLATEESSSTIRQTIAFGLLIFIFVSMIVRFFVCGKTVIQRVQISGLIRIILILAYFECRNNNSSQLQEDESSNLEESSNKNVIQNSSSSLGVQNLFGQIYFGACTYILVFQPKFQEILLESQGKSSNEYFTRSLIAAAALTYIALNFGVSNASTIYAMSGFAILMIYSIACGIYSFAQRLRRRGQESIFSRDLNDIFYPNSSSNSAVIFSPRFGGSGINDLNEDHSNPTTITVSATAFTSTNLPAPKAAPAISQAISSRIDSSNRQKPADNVTAYATFHGNQGENNEEHTKKEESKDSKGKSSSSSGFPSTNNKKNIGNSSHIQRKGSGVNEENSISFGSCAAVETREYGVGVLTSGRGLMDGEELFSESLSARNNEEFSDLQAALENNQLHIQFEAAATTATAKQQQRQDEGEVEEEEKGDQGEDEDEEEKRNDDFAYGNYARDDEDDDQEDDEDEEDNENQDSLFDFENDKNSNQPRRRSSNSNSSNYSRNSTYGTSKNTSKSNKASLNGSLISGQSRSDITCMANETDASQLGMTASKSMKGVGTSSSSKEQANNLSFDESSFFRLAIQDMILSSVSTGVIVMNKSDDAGESIVYANSQACRFLQCPVEEILPTLSSLRNLLSYRSDEVFNFSEVLEQFEVPSELSNLSTLRGLYMNLSSTKESMICVVPSQEIQAALKKTTKKSKYARAAAEAAEAAAAAIQQQNANARLANNFQKASQSSMVSSVKSFFDMNRVILVEVERVRGPQNGSQQQQQQSKQQHQEYSYKHHENQSKSQKRGVNENSSSQLFHDRYVVFTIREIPKWSNPLSIIHTISLKIHYFIRKMISELSIDMGDIRDYFINLQDVFNRSAQLQQQQSTNQHLSQLSSHSHSNAASLIGNSECGSTLKESEKQSNAAPELEVASDSTIKRFVVADSAHAEAKARNYLNQISPRVDIAGCVGKIDCMSEFLQDFATSSLLISGTFVVLRHQLNLSDLILVVVDKIRRRTTASNYSFSVHYASHVPTRIVSDEKRLDRIFYNLLLYFVDTCEAASIRVNVGSMSVGLKKMLKVVITCEKKKRMPVSIIESVSQNGSTLQEKSQSGPISVSEEPQTPEQIIGTSAKSTKLGDSSKVQSSVEPKMVQLQLSAKKAMITNVQMLESMHYGVLLSSSLLLKLEPNDIGIIFEQGLLTSFSFRLSL